MGERFKIAVLGGTGDLGGGLAWQLVQVGYAVVIGSRTREKAEAAAAALSLRANCNGRVVGMANPEAAAAADLVIMTVPFASHKATLESVREVVQGKILVDATVPLVPPRVMRVQMPDGGSAGPAPPGRLRPLPGTPPSPLRRRQRLGWPRRPAAPPGARRHGSISFAGNKIGPSR